ncbi:hypothetical protein, partial [Pseudomonas amygdali]
MILLISDLHLEQERP